MSKIYRDIQIESRIKEIENRIGQAAKNAHFGDSSFSDWYDSQVAEIEKLKRQLSK